MIQWCAVSPVHQRQFIASAAASEADLNAAPSCHRIRAPTYASSHAHKTYFPALQAGRPPSVIRTSLADFLNARRFPERHLRDPKGTAAAATRLAPSGETVLR